MKFVKQILKDNEIKYSEITFIDGGFANKAYNVDDLYIIRISTKGIKGFTTEQQVLDSINNRVSTSKILKIGSVSIQEEQAYYSIVEKINGQPLSTVWMTANSDIRSHFLADIAEQMKLLHSLPISEFAYLKTKASFLSKVSNDINLGLEAALDNGLPQTIYNELRTFYNSNSNSLLKKRNDVLCHTDLHFENILVSDDNEIFLIDFEGASLAPAFYDFSGFSSFALAPKSLSYMKYSDQYPLDIYPALIKGYPILLDEENPSTLIKLFMIETIIWAWRNMSHKLIEDKVFRDFSRQQSLIIYDRVFNKHIVSKWINAV